MYRGRFAPSPTGKLHIGSLYTAIASYCEAQKNNGTWLVRMEDLDPPREIAGAAQSILQTLSSLGFEYNKEILFQSQTERQQAYQIALEQLQLTGKLYYCSCSRTRPNFDTDKNHLCLNQKTPPAKEYSIKIQVDDIDIEFEDQIQGPIKKNLKKDCGDFILKRKDGLFSYQLAVVVDDEFQQINNILRGIDLLESTPWQIFLYQQMNYQLPHYAHLPILVNENKQKLSKQTFAKEIDITNPLPSLLSAYSFLGQKSFSQTPKTLESFWKHAIDNWKLNNIPKSESIQV